MATGFEVANHPVVYAVRKLKKVHILHKWHMFHTVKSLVIITKPPLPVDIVHLSGANFLLLALCRYTFPSAFCFSLNTHLQSIASFQHLNPFHQMSHCIHRCGCLWQDPPYQSSLQNSDLDALTVFATCVCNSDDLFPTWPRLPFQFYAYTVTCISYFQAFLPTANSFSFFLMKHWLSVNSTVLPLLVNLFNDNKLPVNVGAYRTFSTLIRWIKVQFR